jgi:hypothetical protein
MASVPVVTEGATIVLDPILASSDGTNDILVSDLIEMLGDKYTPISSTTPKGIAIIISSFINVESGTPDSYDFGWNIINQDNEITFSVQGPPEPDINNQIYSYYFKNLKLRFTNIVHNYGKTEFQFFIWEPADNFDDGTNMYITSGDPFYNVSINRVTVKLNICIPPQIVNTSISIGNTLEISVIPRDIDLGIDINTILSYIGGNYILGSESTKGIAIYSIDNTTGVWQYCLEIPTSDDSFINIPSIPSSNVFLLSDSNNTGVRIRYVPNQFTIGQKSIHVRAWDTLYGTSGSLYDYTTVRGIASIGSQTAELVIDVLPANTTPGSISPSTVSMTTITENMRLSQAYLNGEYIKNLTGIQYTEGSLSFKGVAIYEIDNTNGVWQYSISGGDINIPWTNIPAVDSSNYLLLKYEETKIRFIPHKAYYSSELTEYKRNVTQYNYVRVMEDTDPDFKYQYKDETERIQTKLGKITTPQAIAFRRNGGPPCS